ncbi:MAG: 50S ribosomal protein L22 [Candidatus Altiarchaeota archaeon]
MEIKYAFKPKNKSKSVVAAGRDLNMSFKDAVNVCTAVKGLKLADAMALMENVKVKKTPIPSVKYKLGVGHRKGDVPKSGKYPVKVAGEMLKLLNNLQANAEYKALDVEKIKIKHALALRGFSRAKRKPKGRWKTWNTEYTHMQIMGEES